MKRKRISLTVSSAKATIIGAIFCGIATIIGAMLTRPEGKKSSSLSSDNLKQSKHIQLVQFAINDDSCLYMSNNGDSSYFPGSEKVTKYKRSLNPVFDLTVVNNTNEQVVFTQIKVTVKNFTGLKGDGSPGVRSEVIKSLNKYSVSLPPLDFLEVDEGAPPAKPLMIIKDAIPPLAIPAHTPARIQLELVPHNENEGDGDILLEFYFSNKDIVKKQIFMDF